MVIRCHLPWGMKAQEKTVQQCIVRAVGLCRRYKDTFLAQTAPFPEVYARGSLVFVSMAGTSIEPGCLYRGYLPGYTVTQGHTLALEKKMLVSERCLWGRYLSASSDVDFLQVLSIDKSPPVYHPVPGRWSGCASGQEGSFRRQDALASHPRTHPQGHTGHLPPFQDRTTVSGGDGLWRRLSVLLVERTGRG